MVAIRNTTRRRIWTKYDALKVVLSSTARNSIFVPRAAGGFFRTRSENHPRGQFEDHEGEISTRGLKRSFKPRVEISPEWSSNCPEWMIFRPSAKKAALPEERMMLFAFGKTKNECFYSHNWSASVCQRLLKSDNPGIAN